MLTKQNLLLEDVYPGGAPKSRVVLPCRKSPGPSRVFAEALLENSTTRQRRSPMDWALSFLIHFAILILLLLSSALFFARDRYEETGNNSPRSAHASDGARASSSGFRGSRRSCCSKSVHSREADRADVYSQGGSDGLHGLRSAAGSIGGGHECGAGRRPRRLDGRDQWRNAECCGACDCAAGC